MQYIIDNDHFDSESTNIAIGLHKLKNQKFVFMLLLYKKVFVYIDHLFAVLQSKIMSNVLLCNTEVNSTITNLKEMRNDASISEIFGETIIMCNNIEIDDKNKQLLSCLAFEILNSIVGQLEIRFSDISKLKFVELLNASYFVNYKIKFPDEKLYALCQIYPNIFNVEKLKN